MKKIVSFLILLISVLSLASCGDMKLKRKEIVGTGDKIQIEYVNLTGSSLSVSQIQVKNTNHEIVPIELYLYGGAEKKIIVEAQASLFDSLTVESIFDTIQVFGETRTTYITDSITVRVYGIEISSLSVELTNVTVEDESLFLSDLDLSLLMASKLSLADYSGKSLKLAVKGGSVFSCDRITAKKLEISMNGQSSCIIDTMSVSDLKIMASENSNLESNAENSTGISIDISDSATIALTGSTDTMSLVSSGESKFLGEKLFTQLSTVVMSGKSVAYVWSSKGITLIASGTSSLVYYGTGTLAQTNISGQATVKRGD